MTKAVHIWVGLVGCHCAGFGEVSGLFSGGVAVSRAARRRRALHFSLTLSKYGEIRNGTLLHHALQPCMIPWTL